MMMGEMEKDMCRLAEMRDDKHKQNMTNIELIV